jgi:tetratricopeptide (TPR) repeat protein
MNKTQILLIVVGLLLVVVIFRLPKVVVDNVEESGGRQAIDLIDVDGGSAVMASESLHGATLPYDVQSEIDQLRKIASESSISGEINDAAERLAEIYERFNRFDSAAHFAERLAFNKPTDQNIRRAAFLYFDAYSFSIDRAKAAQNKDKALEYLERVMEKNPDDLDAIARKGLILVSSPQPMQGILMVRGVLEKDPTNEFALLNMGLLSIESGQFDRAVEYLERYTQLYPSNDDARLYLGMSYLESGKKTKAKEILDLLEQETNNAAIIKSIEDLRNRL